jgi:hypothetical protein
MKRLFISALCLGLLASCGDRYIKTGVFLDSAVENLYYKTDELSGYTDALGTFRFRPDEQVRFYIGSAEIGSAEGQKKLTPFDITDDDDVDDDRTMNIAVLLQSLDQDGDPDNGIYLSEAAHNSAPADLSLRLDQTEAEFESDQVIEKYVFSVSSSTLVSRTVALAHLQDTIDNINENDSPIATIENGDAITVTSGESVTLTGGVSDPDGYVVAYEWSQIDTTSVDVTFDDTEDAVSDNEKSATFSVTFDAPAVTSNTVLTFQLLVEDNEGATAKDSINVTVQPAS